MLTTRRADDRGVADFGWLNSHHTFSFGNYYDPTQMGFGDLRVINEDRVIGGEGFPTHSHRDMEIISYVISGALEHKDSIGTGSVIRPGDVQRMSAGTGISHSEYNHSKTEPVHFLQIWIILAQSGLEPSYEQRHYNTASKQDQLRLVASQDGRDQSVLIHQDVDLYASNLSSDAELTHELNPKKGNGASRQAWVQVVKGEMMVNDEALVAGDGVAIANISALTLKSISDNSEFLLFDLAA